MGCAFHHLGLLHLAIPMYEKAIAMPPPTPSPGKRQLCQRDRTGKPEKSGGNWIFVFLIQSLSGHPHVRKSHRPATPHPQPRQAQPSHRNKTENHERIRWEYGAQLDLCVPDKVHVRPSPWTGKPLPCHPLPPAQASAAFPIEKDGENLRNCIGLLGSPSQPCQASRKNEKEKAIALPFLPLSPGKRILPQQP